jgi:hypothetical protein
MSNPTVDKLTGELSDAVERWYDRCQNAIGRARNGNYEFTQLAKDVTDTWVDSTYLTMLPLSLFGGVSVAITPPFPVVHFKLCSKSDTSRMLLVQNLASFGAIAPQTLFDASGVNSIPTTSVTVTKATATYIKVALSNLTGLAIPPGLYSGLIVDPTNAHVAGIEVDFPGT